MNTKGPLSFGGLEVMHGFAPVLRVGPPNPMMRMGQPYINIFGPVKWTVVI